MKSKVMKLPRFYKHVFEQKLNSCMGIKCSECPISILYSSGQARGCMAVEWWKKLHPGVKFNSETVLYEYVVAMTKLKKIDKILE